jgi:hypothetical protein
LNELINVAALLAAEAMEKTVRRVDLERRCLLRVQGAEPLEGAGPRLLEGRVTRNYFCDIGALSESVDIFFPDLGHKPL